METPGEGVSGGGGDGAGRGRDRPKVPTAVERSKRVPGRFTGCADRRASAGRVRERT